MLYIVVPTFNRIKIFNDFINQLRDQTCQDYQLIVVDHGKEKTNYSADKTIVIESDVNGWSYAINVGIRYVLNLDKLNDSDHIMVINDDVLMKDDFIVNVIETIREKPNSCIGSVCYDWNDPKTIHVNMLLNKTKADFIYYNKGLNLDDLHDDYYQSDVLKGRGTVWPVHVLRKIGIYNEKKLPHYRADHELAWRAKKNGYEVIVAKRMQLGAILDSPHQIDKSKGFWENYKNIFHHMISTKNSKDLWNYSFELFNCMYGFYYWGVNWLRYHLFFIYLYFIK